MAMTNAQKQAALRARRRHKTKLVSVYIKGGISGELERFMREHEMTQEAAVNFLMQAGLSGLAHPETGPFLFKQARFMLDSSMPASELIGGAINPNQMPLTGIETDE